MRNKKTHSEYEAQLKELGIEINERYNGIHTPINHTCPVCKRKNWKVEPNSILSKRATKCLKCRHSEMETKEYRELALCLGIKVIGEYVKSATKIAHECPVCKRHDWMVRPFDIIHTDVRMCSTCRNELQESVMATTLKQVLKHEYPDTILEYDAGFRGPKGGISKYDIYIPHLNTLIECQSEYHDEAERQKIDELKRVYAIKNNYKLISLDRRDYTPLEAINRFFTSITEIPDYVRIDKYSNERIKIIKEEQELLNKGYSYTDIARHLGVTYNSIVNNVKTGKITKDFRSSKSNNIRTGVLEKAQLLLNAGYTYKEIEKALDIKYQTLATYVSRGKLIKTDNVNSERILQVTQDTGNICSIKEINMKEYRFDIGTIEYEIKIEIARACCNGNKFKGHNWYFKSQYEKYKTGGK